MGLFLFFILVLNIVAIALIYYCLSELEQKEKIIFIAVGVALMYVLTSFVYWLSTKGIAIKEVSETGKNLITFLFVPINGLIVLPIFAKSYEKYKMGALAGEHLRNRGIVLAILLFIVLIFECSYFKDIQNGVVGLLQKNYRQKVESMQTNQENTQTQNNQIETEGPVITTNEKESNQTNELTNTDTNANLDNEMVNDTINEME